MPSRVRILLVDDNLLLRSGLRALLKGEPTFELVGEAGDGETAVRLAADLSPDVVLMDINLPQMNGIEATRQIVQAATAGGRSITVLAMSSDSFDKQAVLDAGAVGFIPKERAHELVTSIKSILAGST